MKRTFATILIAVAAAVLFASLVHGVLVAAHVSEPGATTIYGLTTRRLWATVAAGWGLIGVIVGGLALANRDHRYGMAGHIATIVAFVAALIAVINGGLNLAVATGGPGSGNGVVGGAAALVLGLIALMLVGLSVARRRRVTLEHMT
jgi:hypothetical protein